MRYPLSVFHTSIICLLTAISIAHAAIIAPIEPEIWVRYPDIPLIKREEVNALACVRFFVEEAHENQKISGIVVESDADAVSTIESLIVFDNSNEPLFIAAASQVAKSTPVKGKKTIKVNIPSRQGWNYLWIGATLKPDASLDARPTIYVSGLTNQAGNPLPISTVSGKAKKRIGIAIRKAGDDNVHTYRIPGIAQTDKGTLIAVYDNRYETSKDLPGNIDVGMSRSTDGGQTWEPMKVIIDMGAPHENNGVGDPAVLFDPATKTIWVAALWSKGNRSIAGSEPGLSPDESGQIVLVSSNDDGVTWSQPYNITSQVKNPIWHIYFNGPGSGIVMKDGTLVFAAQYWDESKKPGIPHSTIMYSKDHGKTWHSGTGVKKLTTESQVVEISPGTLMLNMRDQRGYFRSVATTTDMGKTWKEHKTSFNALPDPICMGSIIKAPFSSGGSKKDLLFFSNVNNSSVEHGRKDMTIKASFDGGESWLLKHQLLIDERYCFGYSSLTPVDPKTIGILYEGLRDLYFLSVPISEIINQP